MFCVVFALSNHIKNILCEVCKLCISNIIKKINIFGIFCDVLLN